MAAGAHCTGICRLKDADMHPCLHQSAAEVFWFMDGLAEPHVAFPGIGRFILLQRWIQHNSFISAFWWDNISLTEKKNIFKMVLHRMSCCPRLFITVIHCNFISFGKCSHCCSRPLCTPICQLGWSDLLHGEPGVGRILRCIKMWNYWLLFSPNFTWIAQTDECTCCVLLISFLQTFQFFMAETTVLIHAWFKSSSEGCWLS